MDRLLCCGAKALSLRKSGPYGHCHMLVFRKGHPKINDLIEKTWYSSFCLVCVFLRADAAQYAMITPNVRGLGNRLDDVDSRRPSQVCVPLSDCCLEYHRASDSIRGRAGLVPYILLCRKPLESTPPIWLNAYYKAKSWLLATRTITVHFCAPRCVS